MHKSIPFIFEYTKKATRNNKLIIRKNKFIKDKLEHILTPETKEYLSLKKQLEHENNRNS